MSVSLKKTSNLADKANIHRLAAISYVTICHLLKVKRHKLNLFSEYPKIGIVYVYRLARTLSADFPPLVLRGTARSGAKGRNRVCHLDTELKRRLLSYIIIIYLQ